MIVATTIGARLFAGLMSKGALGARRVFGWLFCLGLIFGAGFYVESLRWAAADNSRIKAEAQTEHDRIVKRDREVEHDSHAANASAAYFEAERQKLEAAYVLASTKLRTALQRPISCPAGALALGDVVIHDDVVRELRAAAGEDRVPAAGPGASEPDR